MNVNFTGSADVKLVEKDSIDSDDVLGRATVSSGSGIMEFARDEANYKVTYNVT